MLIDTCLAIDLLRYSQCNFLPIRLRTSWNPAGGPHYLYRCVFLSVLLLWCCRSRVEWMTANVTFLSTSDNRVCGQVRPSNVHWVHMLTREVRVFTETYSVRRIPPCIINQTLKALKALCGCSPNTKVTKWRNCWLLVEISFPSVEK